MSKGGYEDVLVITDHFTRFAMAIPTRNQTAATTAKALYEQFIVHYSFPERIHSDQGGNFESKVIRELCKLAGIQKSRTTPYHPMGNGMVERFNQTLIKMIGTLQDHQKSDWKSYIPALVQAYNSTKHESTGYAPHFLMFGWNPRLAVDVYLDLENQNEGSKRRENYVDKLKRRMKFAYKVAKSESEKKSRRNKDNYDMKARESKLEVGDRVLVRNVRSRSKLDDRWERDVYVVISIPNSDIPVYTVRKEKGDAKTRTLHRNLLLPFSYIPCSDSSENTKVNPTKVNRKSVSRSKPTESDYSSDSSYGSEKMYVVPARRRLPNDFSHNTRSLPGPNPSSATSTNSTASSESSKHTSSLSESTKLSTTDSQGSSEVVVPRRSGRNRKPPDRYGSWAAMTHTHGEIFV